MPSTQGDTWNTYKETERELGDEGLPTVDRPIGPQAFIQVRRGTRPVPGFTDDQAGFTGLLKIGDRAKAQGLQVGATGGLQDGLPTVSTLRNMTPDDSVPLKWPPMTVSL